MTELKFDTIDKTRETITDDTEREQDLASGGDGCVEVIRLKAAENTLALIYPTNAWIYV
jgi:hypothetical protein